MNTAAAAAAAEIVEQVRRGELTLPEAHTALRAVKGRPKVSVGDAAAASPHSWSVELGDAAALAGLSVDSTFTAATPDAADALESVLASGGLRRPYPTFPWWPRPDAPF